MAHSLEIRVPYIDPAFFRAVLGAGAAGMPPGKADIARRLVPALPEEILMRRKTGFRAPVHEWCADPDREGQVDRGLRGWARIVIGDSLGATGAAVMRPGAGNAAFVPTWRRVARARCHGARQRVQCGASRAPVRALRRAQAAAVKAAYVATNATLKLAALALWPRARPAYAEQVVRLPDRQHRATSFARCLRSPA